MGRHSTLTPQIAAHLVAAVRTGANVVNAARASGVAPSTVYAWLQRGQRAPRSEFGALRRALVDAERTARRIRIHAIDAASQEMSA